MKFIGEDLPLDGRTLLKTPKETNIMEMSPGEHCHFGLEAGLSRTVSKCGNVDSRTQNLLIHVDSVLYFPCLPLPIGGR